MITPLNLPKADLRLKKKSGQVLVWSILRKKELVLTPEEWVRQHFIHYLINDCGVAHGLIAPEYKIEYNGRSKRADLVLFGTDQQPKLIVECKAPEVDLTQAVLNQIAAYNHELQVELLIMTNGIQHIYCKVDASTGQIEYFEEIEPLLIRLQA